MVQREKRAKRWQDKVVAETLPELTASIRGMEKCGMRFIGNGSGHRWRMWLS